MTRKEIIDGLKFTVEMFLFDPSTGEVFTEPRNDMDKTTIEACKGAIELLEQTDGDLISREVVIEWLKGKDIIKLSSQEEMARKELKALSSVELQPCVENMPRTDGDLISRQAAIDIVVFECGKWTGLAKEISKQLKQLPSADNTAEWVSKEGIFGAAYCSKCDYELRTNDTNYCPNCGRRMLGEQTE